MYALIEINEYAYLISKRKEYLASDQKEHLVPNRKEHCVSLRKLKVRHGVCRKEAMQLAAMHDHRLIFRIKSVTPFQTKRSTWCLQEGGHAARYNARPPLDLTHRESQAADSPHHRHAHRQLSAHPPHVSHVRQTADPGAVRLQGPHRMRWGTRARGLRNPVCQLAKHQADEAESLWVCAVPSAQDACHRYFYYGCIGLALQRCIRDGAAQSRCFAWAAPITSSIT